MLERPTVPALLVATLLGSLALAIAGVGAPSTRVAAQPAPAARAGFQIRFAMVGSAGGLEGRAFLPSLPTRVHLRPITEAGCGSAHVLEATGSSLRGYVRSITLVLRATGPGEVVLRAGACPSASLEATLEDGRVLRGGEGTVTVDAWNTEPGGEAAVHFAWTPVLGREPMPFHGEGRFALPR